RRPGPRRRADAPTRRGALPDGGARPGTWAPRPPEAGDASGGAETNRESVLMAGPGALLIEAGPETAWPARATPVPSRARAPGGGGGGGGVRRTEAVSARLAAARRHPLADRLRASPLVWEPTGGGGVPYRTRVGGRALTVRVDDLPAEPLSTLLVDGQSVDE